MYLSIILFIIFSSLSLSQHISNWQNYTDMKNVKSFSVENNRVWSASDGGVFSYNFSDNSFKTYSKTDGLNGVLITSVAIDKYGKTWFGSSNGIIDVYDPQTNSFRTVLDIFNSDKTSKVINEITASGDTIIISSDFGISLINATTFFFIDTFFKFGNFPSNIGVNSIFKSGAIYACTDRGVAIQKPGITNLSAPESWNVYNISDGLPSDSVTKIVLFKDTIITATSKGLAFFNGTSWSAYLNQFNNILVNDLLQTGDSIIILSDNKNIFLYHNGNLNPVYSSQERNLNKLNYSSEKGLMIATKNGILRLSDGIFIHPDSPLGNQFPNITIDNNGVLWSASGTSSTGIGFYNYNGNQWTNYNRSTNPELPSNAYYSVYAGSNNNIYLGNWGQGFTVYQNGEFKNYKENVGIQGILGNPNFVVITGFAEDSKNNIWVLNYGAADRKFLSKSSNLEQWDYFSVPAAGNVYLQEFYNLIIDQFDTKWFSLSLQGRQGLFYFNERNTEETSDDISGFLDVSSGLNNNFITSIKIDRRGDLWVGTGLGINIISNISSALSANPQLRISSVFSLRQQAITAIVVDPLNQKWVGTNQGLILVNPDGTNLLATFDTKNSPLLSDQITSLAVDENSGTIYVGTDRGLTSFKTASVKPNENFDELFAYPNPFILNKQNNLITIDGLIRDTDIKVLSINGKLVKEFTTPGGRVALWDGRDGFGNLVSSGVYFIVAFDKEGNNVAKTKIAVLREE